MQCLFRYNGAEWGGGNLHDPGSVNGKKLATSVQKVQGTNTKE